MWTEPEFRLDVARTAAASEEAESLVQEHLRGSGQAAYLHLALQLTQQFLSGLGMQLRSMPISLRVDDWIFLEYPDLRDLQRQSIVVQLQEAMQALGPDVKAIAPPEIVAANIAMSTALAKFWSGRWNDAAVELPFVSAGYDRVGSELLQFVRTADPTPNGDRALVESWARHLKLDRWFQVIDGCPPEFLHRLNLELELDVFRSQPIACRPFSTEPTNERRPVQRLSQRC